MHHAALSAAIPQRSILLWMAAAATPTSLDHGASYQPCQFQLDPMVINGKQPQNEYWTTRLNKSSVVQSHETPCPPKTLCRP